MMNATRAAPLLKQIRAESGLSVRYVAGRLDMPASTYSSYEDKFKKKYLPIDLARKLAEIFAAKGISKERVMALAGIDEDDEDGYDPSASADISELDIRGSMGGGAISDDENVPVMNIWRVPRDFLRAATYADAGRIKIVTVVGDSMEGTFRPYERVLVDTTDTVPTPPGVFVVYDGLGLVVKRVEHIPHSDPPSVRITSDNPRYSAYERTLEEAYIQGRVLGRWQWV